MLLGYVCYTSESACMADTDNVEVNVCVLGIFMLYVRKCGGKSMCGWEYVC